jgi:Maltokinase N-terminal cap domain
MAVIHQTTMSPTKLALLAAWLPGQPWYTGTGRSPDLARAGGFRLDDPQGEVGIEFMAVTDRAGDIATTYHVPLTYRGDAFERISSALIGTSEHGVLGRRWIYDGAADPVLVAQLVALIQGEVQAQAQTVSDTPDTTVACTPVGGARLSVYGSPELSGDATGTEILVPTVTADGGVRQLVVGILRLLSPAPVLATPDEGGGSVSATWRLADGTQARGPFVTASIR